MPSRSMNAPKSVRFLTVPCDAIADVDAFEEFLSLLAALLLDQFAPAEHDVFAVVVNLNDLKIVGVTNKLLQIFRRNDVDLGCRQKRFDADVHHQTAFNDGFHLAFDQAIALERRATILFQFCR